MGYEIDYLPVGQKPEEKSGDAIAMRFWDETPDKSAVITIDGGTRDSGASLVEHIKKYYNTAKVQIAILTHPDGDHASGLRDILEQMQVGALLSFVPWEHARSILPIVQVSDSKVTESSIAKRLKESFPAAVEAIELARDKGVSVFEPSASKKPVKLTDTTTAYLLGPSMETYLVKWLPYYECLPTKTVGWAGLLEAIAKKAEKAIKWVRETWDKELLVDPQADEANAENNSSVILGVTQGEKRFLFSGDAGVPALYEALSNGKTMGLSPSSFTFFHVPHHGSRHNIGPSLLNLMFGKPRPLQGGVQDITAFLSATKGDPKHPSRRVTNALNRRGVKVISTGGSAKLHHSSDSPSRGWSKAEPIPFYDSVEDVED